LNARKKIQLFCFNWVFPIFLSLLPFPLLLWEGEKQASTAFFEKGRTWLKETDAIVKFLEKASENSFWAGFLARQLKRRIEKELFF